MWRFASGVVGAVQILGRALIPLKQLTNLRLHTHTHTSHSTSNVIRLQKKL